VLTNGGYVDDKRHPSEGAGHSATRQA
jgi:hypothetical protein